MEEESEVGHRMMKGQGEWRETKKGIGGVCFHKEGKGWRMKGIGEDAEGGRGQMEEEGLMVDHRGQRTTKLQEEECEG